MAKKSDGQTPAAKLRQLAEKKMKRGKKAKTAPPLAKADLLHLIHELEVHQIELELQNEELMRSRAELEAAYRQFSDLYDFAPVGYFTLSLDGRIKNVNLAGTTLLGVERSRLINMPLGWFISLESRPAFQAFFEKITSSETDETCELSFLREETELFWAHLDATSFRGGQECHIVLVDITRRKQAEDALRHLGNHDALTGLYNHGFFMEEMERLERGRNYPISIVMADVDHLKEINDQKGHALGDAMLKRVADLLLAAFRAEDVVARIGGDEFAVLLPATNSYSAEVSLQRARKLLEKSNAAHPDIQISISFGVSTALAPMRLSETLKKADANMYREKRGRKD